MGAKKYTRYKQISRYGFLMLESMRHPSSSLLDIVKPSNTAQPGEESIIVRSLRGTPGHRESAQQCTILLLSMPRVAFRVSTTSWDSCTMWR